MIERANAGEIASLLRLDESLKSLIVNLLNHTYLNQVSAMMSTPELNPNEKDYAIVFQRRYQFSLSSPYLCIPKYINKRSSDKRQQEIVIVTLLVVFRGFPDLRCVLCRCVD